MTKRKYDEINHSEATSNSAKARTLRIQRLQLDGQLDQSKKSLFRSLKVARGFERQKLGRRQKTAKTENNTTDATRLEAEVAALKSLDLTSVAEIHFYKSLLRTKSIATAPAFPHHVHATIEASRKPQETASANVQARLFKSGPVQAAMTNALKGIRAVLGIEEVRPKGRKRMRAKDYEDSYMANDATERAVSKRVEPSKPTTGASNEEEWTGLSAHESSDDDRDQGVGDEKEDVDYDLYASRLAQSSDEESMGENIEGQNHDRDKLNDMSITDEEPSAEDSHDEEGEEEEEQGDSRVSDAEDNNQWSKRPIPKTKLKPPTAPPKTTTFLPSLSLGGYWSGSDTSHPSSDNDSSAAKIQVRKNRMGQQARRALWEKKFGQNANHVKKQGHVHDRNQGWDPRKGAQGVDDEKGKRGRGRSRGRGSGRGVVDARRGGGRGSRVDGGRFAESTGANSDPVVPRKTKGNPATEGPLHPSWEAARKAKEQKKVMPFQGKKVVFE